ncbi:MAG: hypothetical protein IH588_02195 [Anaerolineales bacterium]|nr:hypothetical protein [Anaerolineales bacterium]
MEERSTAENREKEIDLGKHFAILRKEWWKIGLLSLGIGFLTLLLLFLRPNVYQAVAVITPAIEEQRQNPALGALASFGVDIGGPSKVEDLDTLFRSNDLTVRVFRKYNLWPILLKDRYDPATGNIRGSWTDPLFGGGKGPKRPGDWDAIREAKNRMKISMNKRAGTLFLSIESPSAEGSAAILKNYLDEGKSRLQEEAFERAEKNKKFIQEQIGKTVDALTRDRLYTLYGQEVEREMLARNREQFGFQIIDSPRVPDRKIKPQRAKGAVAATVLSFMGLCGFFVFRGRPLK